MKSSMPRWVIISTLRIWVSASLIRPASVILISMLLSFGTAGALLCPDFIFIHIVFSGT